MRLSDTITEYICRLLDRESGTAEFCRNELAETLGCVPSQISYVITSRFSPEHGYFVESRRGGGGYIRITRVSSGTENALMEIIHSIGASLSAGTAALLLHNMTRRSLLSGEQEKLIRAATADQSYAAIPQEYRDQARAAAMKNMLIVLIKEQRRNFE